jgi:hypothetical protein
MAALEMFLLCSISRTVSRDGVRAEGGQDRKTAKFPLIRRCFAADISLFRRCYFAVPKGIATDNNKVNSICYETFSTAGF